MIISLFSIGLVSILGQVVLLRELNVSFYGVELIYLLALGIWLFWTAVGALAARRIDLTSGKALALLFIIFGIILPLDIVFIRASRLLVGGVPGAYLSFSSNLRLRSFHSCPRGCFPAFYSSSPQSYTSRKGKRWPLPTPSKVSAG